MQHNSRDIYFKHLYLVCLLPFVPPLLQATPIDSTIPEVETVSYQAISLPRGPSGSYLDATGINNAGLVVGDYYIPAFEGGGTAGFTYNPNTEAFTSFALSPNSIGNDLRINDSGVVIGNEVAIGGGYDGFIGRAGALTKLVVPGATSTSLYAINNAGTVVGSYTDANDAVHGFVYQQNGVFQTIDAPSGNTVLSGINNVGQIVGYTPSTAFVYSNNAFLEFSNGGPTAINDLGLIAITGGVHGAILYDFGTNIYFQNVGDHIYPPYGLNNAGVVVAQDAFFYTPIPEPGSAFLLLSAGLSLLVFNRLMTLTTTRRFRSLTKPPTSSTALPEIPALQAESHHIVS